MARSFEWWMERVDNNLERKCGLSNLDLADCCYRDWYDDGISSSEAASMALEENGF